MKVHRRGCRAAKIESNLDPAIDALGDKVRGSIVRPMTLLSVVKPLVLNCNRIQGILF
jgi:hypothetical protein